MKILMQFILCLFLLLPLQSVTQSANTPTSPYTEWQCANPNQYGSFWWYVERTDYKYNGNYYYYVYFYSNSYLQNHDINYRAITYIDAPKVTMYFQKGKYYRTYPMTYSLVDWDKTKICYFFTSDPYATFALRWSGVTPYDYSTK